MTKEDFEQLESTVKQWLFHTGALDPTDYANELKLKFIEPREKRIEELEQETARLKLELEVLDGQIPWKDIKDKSEVLGKLTEAKDIIRQLLLLPYANNEEVNADVTSILDKAESFLKE